MEEDLVDAFELRTKLNRAIWRIEQLERETAKLRELITELNKRMYHHTHVTHKGWGRTGKDLPDVKTNQQDAVTDPDEIRGEVAG